ncbi:hypothetical protein RJZ56_005410 [Blastomyces dermatitidis]|uniref:Uncharacterized protein n=3 Tax=Blastomyces TaxID=229219 RepID=A0A179UY06_BLAGS|nr:uncharacterized protein BDBG_06814 [Blastomyces gilchristii SLH14081]XP_031579763.1 hypothetical protein, variant 1 [Blastomyces gilchristii SLH14081]XP_031579764.1 hypothetical protein, variant 2 [Blastomyces gilchristii SLH14081]XP_045274630.1 uncharacterized protein BDCG_02396 [Blastomyces dermatitidis ER-3]XP_045280033.1 hypothetical protein, variant 1 [Blastomyces dermatitidis ER-3]XP_045280034.1 hypothetical protein, variant 2 [Blastomyces dermatitidis ER-3]EGE85683.1 hypothetical pr
MSPARTSEKNEQRKEIIALARGFDTLIDTIQKLAWQERELWNKLQFAHNEYLKLASQLPNRSGTETEIAEKIYPVPFEKSNCDTPADHTGWIYDVEKAGYITTSELDVIAKGLEAYRNLADRRITRDGYHQNNNTCLVAVDAKARSSLEHDFTVKGVQGNLRCPFAIPNGTGPAPKLANQSSDTCAHDLDPIKAESLQGTRSCSVQDAVPRCPIRYLDDHSPEEVAKYFQKHKHEIPRSHAICIQRYQRDSKSIRQLDEKYGDMVNMIKGLGLYHQPYLPSTQGPGRPGDTASVSIGRVEKWAEEVGAKAPEIEVMPASRGEEDHAKEEKEDDDEEQRSNYFNRSLRDVRVGESPSRPWGIHVPISHQNVVPSPNLSPAAPIVDSGVTGSPRLEDYEKDGLEQSSVSTPLPEKMRSPPTAGRCPFKNLVDKDAQPPTSVPGSAVADVQTEETPRHLPPDNFISPNNGERQPPPTSSVQPKMVFHGPVFFGYSAEQTATLLQQLSHSSSLK